MRPTATAVEDAGDCFCPPVLAAHWTDPNHLASGTTAAAGLTVMTALVFGLKMVPDPLAVENYPSASVAPPDPGPYNHPAWSHFRHLTVHCTHHSVAVAESVGECAEPVRRSAADSADLVVAAAVAEAVEVEAPVMAVVAVVDSLIEPQVTSLTASVAVGRRWVSGCLDWATGVGTYGAGTNCFPFGVSWPKPWRSMVEERHAAHRMAGLVWLSSTWVVRRWDFEKR